MSRFLILLGGELHRTPRLDAQIAGSRVIAADSGMRHAAMLGVTPELWMGDFDSVPQALIEAVPDIPRDVYPSEKDKTDGELAIAAAVERGATFLVLAGAFGGDRPDHAFLHLAQALNLAETGLPTIITSGRQEGHPLLTGNRHRFDYPQGTLFSILAFEELSGLTVEGAKWPLDRVEVPFGSSLPLSNEVQGSLAVTLEKGRAVMVVHFETETMA